MTARTYASFFVAKCNDGDDCVKGLMLLNKDVTCFDGVSTEEEQVILLFVLILDTLPVSPPCSLFLQ